MLSGSLWFLLNEVVERKDIFFSKKESNLLASVVYLNLNLSKSINIMRLFHYSRFSASYFAMIKIIELITRIGAHNIRERGLPSHTVRNLKIQKFNFDFPRKLSIFLGEKLVLFSCWQLWFHEENCQKNFGWKTCQNWTFGQKFDFWNSVQRDLLCCQEKRAAVQILWANFFISSRGVLL